MRYIYESSFFFITFHNLPRERTLKYDRILSYVKRDAIYDRRQTDLMRK